MARGRRYLIENDDPLRDPNTGEWDKDVLKRRARGWIAVLIAFAVLAGGAVLVGGQVVNWFQSTVMGQDYSDSASSETVIVDIPRGSTPFKIGQILQDAGVVKDANTFKRTAGLRPKDVEQLKAGRYKLRKEISSNTALDMLLDPANLVRNVMQIREGTRLDPQQIEVMAQASKISADEFRKAIAKSSKEELGIPNWAKPINSANKVEGFIYPETYDVPEKSSAVQVIRITTSQFNEIAKEVDLVNRAEKTPVKDPYKVLIVASIIEREVFRDEDRPKVARVIYNRLASAEFGHKLQLDSTVAYAVNKTGTVWTTPADRQSNSPYNTYRYPGLPPGPITAPSKKAIEAALNPAEGKWMYFMPVNLDTGETQFSVTREEHAAAERALQAWCKASEANRAKCK